MDKISSRENITDDKKVNKPPLEHELYFQWLFFNISRIPFPVRLETSLQKTL